MYLKREHVAALSEVFGSFTSIDELIKNVKAAEVSGAGGIPGIKLPLTSKEYQELVKRALSKKRFHDPSFPCETPEDKEKLVKWFVDRKIKEFKHTLLGLR